MKARASAIPRCKTAASTFLRRITVNLAPADLPKESGRFDLPIALGILAATGQLPARVLDRYEFAGELSLSGELRPVRGTLAMAYAVTLANSEASGERRGADKPTLRGFIVPSESADEAALVGQVPIYPAKTLLQVVEHLRSDAGEADAQRIEGSGDCSPYAAHISDMFEQGTGGRCALESRGRRPQSLLLGRQAPANMLAQRFAGIFRETTTQRLVRSVLSLAVQFRNAALGTRIYARHITRERRRTRGGGNPPMTGEILWPITACCFSTSCPSLSGECLKRCGSHSNRAALRCRAQRGKSNTPPSFN